MSICAGRVKNGRPAVSQNHQHYKKLKGKHRGSLFYPKYIITKPASAIRTLSSKVDRSDLSRLGSQGHSNLQIRGLSEAELLSSEGDMCSFTAKRYEPARLKGHLVPGTALL